MTSVRLANFSNHRPSPIPPSIMVWKSFVHDQQLSGEEGEKTTKYYQTDLVEREFIPFLCGEEVEVFEIFGPNKL